MIVKFPSRPVLKIEVQERCDRIAVLRRIRKRTEGVAEVQNELFSYLGCERSFMASLAKVLIKRLGKTRRTRKKFSTLSTSCVWKFDGDNSSISKVRLLLLRKLLAILSIITISQLSIVRVPPRLARSLAAVSACRGRSSQLRYLRQS